MEGKDSSFSSEKTNADIAKMFAIMYMGGVNKNAGGAFNRDFAEIDPNNLRKYTRLGALRQPVQSRGRMATRLTAHF